MAHGCEFSIEIGKVTRSSFAEVLGSVSNEPGHYQLEAGLQVRVCKVVRRFNHPDSQKVILREEGKKRRMLIIHHNAGSPVIQDINLMESLTFGVIRRRSNQD